MAIVRSTNVGAPPPTDAEIKRLLLREAKGDQTDWLWQTDAARRLINTTDRFASIFGRTTHQMDGQPLLQVLAGSDWDSGAFTPGLRNLADKLKSREGFHDLRLPVAVGSEERWWEIAATPRHRADGSFDGFIGVVSDVTEQRASADKINRLARFDYITGLPNRLMTYETLAGACAQSLSGIGACYLRIIAITNLNDIKVRYSYSLAERVLSIFSEALASLMTESSMVGQIAPGEFALIWQDLSGSEAIADATALIDTALARINLRHISLNVRDIHYSSGTARFKDDGITAPDLIAAALSQIYARNVDESVSAMRDQLAKEGIGTTRRRIIAQHAPAIAAGVDTLLAEHRQRLHNGPPEAINQAELGRIQELSDEIGNLVVLADEDGAIEKKISLIDSLTKSVFRYSHDTGELFVAGLKPFLASVPLATGTLVLLQSICAPAVGGVVGPGAALAVLAGYYGIEAKRAKVDPKDKR